MDKKLRITGFFVLLTIWIGSAYLLYAQQAKNLTVSVSMSAWQDGFIQLFADDGNGFREPLSDRQSFRGDGYPHDFKLFLSIFSPISHLRIDPVNTQANITIHNINVEWQGKSYLFQGNDLKKWYAANDLLIEKLSDKQGLVLNASGNDPQLVLTNSLSYSYQKTLAAFLKDRFAMILAGIIFIFLCLSKESLSYPQQKNFSFSNVCAMLLPVVLFWILYYPALNTWWLYDDSCHLVYIIKNGIYAAFFDKNNGFSYVNFTPFLPLSLGADFHIFGLEPKGFYWHHLLIFSFTLMAAYILLVRFFPAIISGFILSWFVASVPVCDAVYFLMVRHYIEGLLFTIIAIIFFMTSLQKNKQIWSYAGALFYLSACLSKELYVPLIIILIFFPDIPDIKLMSRIKFLYPYFGAALLYTCWRLYMLSFKGVVAGYPGSSVRFQDVLNFPLAAFSMMDWNNYRQWIFMLPMAAGFLLTFKTWSLRKKLIVLTFFICSFLPIVKVLVAASRFLFLLSLLVYVCLGIGLLYISKISSSGAIRQITVIIIGGGLILTGFFSNLQHVSALQQKADTIEAEEKFLLYSDQGNDNVLLTDIGHCYSAFFTLRKELLGLPAGPLYCMNNECICKALYSDKKIWKTERDRLFLYSKGHDNKINSEDCSKKESLSVDIYYTDGFVKWQFGPYQEGNYMLAQIDKEMLTEFISLARLGEYKYKIDLKDTAFVIKYKSSEGWETYSPMLKFDIDNSGKNGVIKWHRN